MHEWDGLTYDDPLATWEILLEAIRDPVFIHDREGRLVRVNRAYLQCCSDPVDAIIGRPYWQVFPKRELPLPGCRVALHHGRERRAEERQAVEELLLETGELLRSHALPLFDPEGAFHYAIHILTRPADLPHPGLDFRFLHAAIEQSADPTLLLDPQGCITYANPAMNRLLGADEDLAGRTMDAIGVRIEGATCPDTLVTTVQQYDSWRGRVAIGADTPTIRHLSITTVRDPSGRAAGFNAVLFEMEGSDSDGGEAL